MNSNNKSQSDGASRRDAEDDLEYLKKLTLDELKRFANGRLVKVVATSGFEEWLLPNEQDHIIFWSPSVEVSTRFIVVHMDSTPTKTLMGMVDNIESITFHEGLEIRPILKIED